MEAIRPATYSVSGCCFPCLSKLSHGRFLPIFTTLNFNGKDQVIISGVAFSDQDIINFISNLNNKDLVDQASLQAINVPKGEGDLQSANNKKGFSILCKLKI